MKTKGEMTRRDLLKMASPLGRVTVDRTRCTGCGLCQAACPTAALKIETDKEGKSFCLMFRHNRCVACGECVEVCPEKCLSVARTVKTDKLSAPEELFRDEFVMCAECGKPVGPRAMLNSIRAKIAASGRPAPMNFDLCPECKVIRQTTGFRKR